MPKTTLAIEVCDLIKRYGDPQSVVLAGLVVLLRFYADVLWLVLGRAACGLARYLLVGP